MRRREEPSPSSPSRRCCLCRPRSSLLDVRDKRISSNLTSIARADIRAAAGSTDQSWGRLFFLLVAINNLDKPAPHGRSGIRGRPLAHHGTCSCRHYLGCRWLCSHWSLTGHPIVGGRCSTVPLFVTAGVLVNLSIDNYWTIHSGRRLHTGRQGHVQSCPVHISNLKQTHDKTLAQEYHDFEIL